MAADNPEHSVNAAGAAPLAVALSPGSVLDGRFRITSLLGHGGMCLVYKAQQLDLDREVAVKLLRGLISNELAKRFHREAVAVTTLAHPNIVKLFSFGCIDDGVPYMVMEYLNGRSLAQLLRQEGRLTRERALPIFLQICDGLEHAHQKGVIHRDIKPSNVMLGKDDDTVKIVDFGVAKLLPQSGRSLQQLTGTADVFGTLLYMSPEQCLGVPVDARTDIYALGCLMYETLSGELPITASSPAAILHKHLAETPAKSTFLNDELGQVIMSCLEKDPNHRPQSAAALKEALIRPRSWKATTKILHRLNARRNPVVRLLLIASVGLGAIVAALLQQPGSPPQGSAQADGQYVSKVAENMTELAHAYHNKKQYELEGQEWERLISYTEPFMKAGMPSAAVYHARGLNGRTQALTLTGHSEEALTAGENEMRLLEAKGSLSRDERTFYCSTALTLGRLYLQKGQRAQALSCWRKTEPYADDEGVATRLECMAARRLSAAAEGK